MGWALAGSVNAGVLLKVMGVGGEGLERQGVMMKGSMEGGAWRD
jgi:hypothetical protein